MKKIELFRLLKEHKYTAIQITMIKILLKTKGIDAAIIAAGKWSK